MAYESFYGGRQGASFVIRDKFRSISDMLDVFAQGGATVDIVNYGEYVIIDTEDKNNPHNGIVYRRGMNYTDPRKDPINPEDPGCGAEYIGQIVGPEGSIKNLEVGAYDATAGTDPLKPGGHNEYAPAEGGLVPGKGQEESGVQVQNNSIKYSYVNVLNAETGHIEKYLIGFQFPYFQQEQEINPVEAYQDPVITDITPIDDDDPEGSHAEQTDRPFYRKYKLSIPKGIKGDSVIDASDMPTIVNADGNVCLYNSVNAVHELEDPDSPLTEPLRLNYKNFVDYKTTKEQGYIKFKITDDNYKYVYLKDTSNEFQHHGFLINKYDESAQGEEEQIDGGISSYIADIQISDGSYGGDNFKDKNYLLIYYSDPTMRAAIPPVKRVKYADKDGWLKLGYVKGDTGTSPIMGFVDTLDDLYTEEGGIRRARTPEEVGGSNTYAGQVVALNSEDINKEIYAYSYINDHDQHLLGVQGSGGGGGFIIDEEPPAKLTVDGIQGQLETITNIDEADPGN